MSMSLNVAGTQEAATTFVLPGTVTLRDVASLHQLMVAVPLPERIDCTAVEEMDITLFQLLAAAKLSAERAGSPLNLVWPQDGRMVALLRLSGLFERLN